MCARPKNIRKISETPGSIGFKPIGSRKHHTIMLHLEEYEAIRLCDYDMMTQAEAAELMEVSRPTLTRIYASARQKIARALVEQSAVMIKGGSAYMDGQWYECQECGTKFNNINPLIREDELCCPVCNGKDIATTESTDTTNKNNMKKIALPSRDGKIDGHFGHCEFYTIVTIDENNQIVKTENMPSPQGCGCKSNIASKFQEDGVTVMLAGNMGAGALNKLSAHGIEVFRGCTGPIMDVLNAYLEGKIQDSGIGCQHHHGNGDHECGHHHGEE